MSHYESAMSIERKEATTGHEQLNLTAIPEGLVDQQATINEGLYLAGDDSIEPINVMPHLLELGPKAQAELSLRANAVATALESAAHHVAENVDYFRSIGIVPNPNDTIAHPCEAEAQSLMEASKSTGNSLIEFGRIDMFPVARADGSLTFQAIEANMRCVEGGSYASILHKMTTELTGTEAPAPMPVESMLHIARSAYYELDEGHKTGGVEPQVGIVYWQNDRVKSVETPNIERLLSQHDAEADIVIGQPDQLQVQTNENGRLDVYLNDDDGQVVKLDVVYRNLGLHDFTWETEAGTVKADLLADIMTNPDRYNCTVVPAARQGWAGYKSLFAMISDPRYTDLLTSGEYAVTPEDLEVARETVGWSRMISDLEAKTAEYQMVVEYPEEFVIKHIAGAGGADVILGWSEESIYEAADKLDVDAQGAINEVWERVVQQAQLNGSYLVQQKIQYLEIIDGKVIDLNPYITQGNYQGQIVSRIGDKHPINVKQGGGLLMVTSQDATYER